MSSDIGGVMVLWLVLWLVVPWLFVYTAVRVAVGHALDRVKPRLLAETQTTPAGVAFTVTNVGTGPAFDLFVRWPGDAAEGALAHSPLLGVNGKLEWTIAAAPAPEEVEKVRSLRLDWSAQLDPARGRKSAVQAVLVPSRLDRQ